MRSIEPLNQHRQVRQAPIVRYRDQPVQNAAAHGLDVVPGNSQRQRGGVNVVDARHPGLLKEISEKKDLSKELTEKVKAVLTEFADLFQVTAKA